MFDAMNIRSAARLTCFLSVLLDPSIHRPQLTKNVAPKLLCSLPLLYSCVPFWGEAGIAQLRRFLAV